jgi:hypothetical protein
LIGLVEKQSIYKNSAHVEERAQAGNAVLRRYIHGPGADAPLVWYEGPTTTDRRWLIPDERGSIIAITNASGTATNINRYDDYGIPAPTNTGRFQYTGQAWVPELQLYYYKARIYAPILASCSAIQQVRRWYDNKCNPIARLPHYWIVIVTELSGKSPRLWAATFLLRLQRRSVAGSRIMRLLPHS